MPSVASFWIHSAHTIPNGSCNSRVFLGPFLCPVLIYPFPAPPKRTTIMWKVEQCLLRWPVLHKNVLKHVNTEALQMATRISAWLGIMLSQNMPNEKYWPFERKMILELCDGFGIPGQAVQHIGVKGLVPNSMQFPCLQKWLIVILQCSKYHLNAPILANVFPTQKYRAVL